MVQDLLSHLIAIYCRYRQHGTRSFITPNCYLLKTAWWKIFAISSVDSMVQDLLSHLIAIYWRQHGESSFITPIWYLLKTAWCKIFAISSVDSMVQNLLSRLITIYWRQHSECKILYYFYYISTKVSKVQDFFITPNCYLLNTAWCRIFYYT